MSDPKPASVIRYSPQCMPIRSATTDELPWEYCRMGRHAPAPGVLKCLQQVWLDGLPHDYGHGPGRLERLGRHRFAGAGVADDRMPVTGEVVQERERARMAMTSDAAAMSKPVAGHPILPGTEPGDDVAQGAIVDVDTCFQVMAWGSRPSRRRCRCGCPPSRPAGCWRPRPVEVPGQVQVEVLNGTTWLTVTGRPPLIPKVGPMEACRMAIAARLPM